jgi:CBS-domain-containing membrane protein
VIVLYLCLLIAAISTVLAKLIAPDEIHQMLIVLSGCVILGWGFLLTPVLMKLLISLVLFALYPRILETDT